MRHSFPIDKENGFFVNVCLLVIMCFLGVLALFESLIEWFEI